MTEEYTDIIAEQLAARGSVWLANWEYPGFTLISCAAARHEIVICCDGPDVLLHVQTADGATVW